MEYGSNCTLVPNKPLLTVIVDELINPLFVFDVMVVIYVVSNTYAMDLGGICILFHCCTSAIHTNHIGNTLRLLVESSETIGIIDIEYIGNCDSMG